MQDEKIEYVQEDDVVGYAIQRSFTDKNLFDVFAVDSNGDFLFCADANLSFEKASALVDAVNQEHFPYVPTPTETVFVKIGGTEKVYNITAK